MDRFELEEHLLGQEQTVERVSDKGERKTQMEYVFPMLRDYAKPLTPLTFPVEGRDHEIGLIQETFARASVSNIFLRGPAGVGKTTLVRAMIKEDKNRLYFEVDLPKMTAVESSGEDVNSVIARRMQAMLDEVKEFGRRARAILASEGVKEMIDIVLFIDEFHLLFQLSPAAVEAMKPDLADSVKRNIRVVGATTNDEYYKYRIDDNLPFIERFVSIQLFPPNDTQVIEILKGSANDAIARDFTLKDKFRNKGIYSQIVEYTNRYIPASSQPRKALMMLDSLIGAARYRNIPVTRKLLAEKIYDLVGVNVAINVDGQQIKSQLSDRVYDQDLAIDAIERYLQLVVADLYDKSRPMASFLFTGASGVGKTELAKALAFVMFGKDDAMIRFNMSEYSEEHRVTALREELARQIDIKPFSILLLDEIEKAHPSCTRLLLQILDDGELSDQNGRLKSFKNTIIISTTNVGADVYSEIAPYLKGRGSSTAMALLKYKPLILKALRDSKSFPNELINRYNAVIPFTPLQNETKLKIAHKKLKDLRQDVFYKHGYDLRVGAEVATWLVYQKGGGVATEDGGARGIVRALDDDFKTAIARAINNGEALEGKLYAAVDPEPDQPDPDRKRDMAFTDDFHKEDISKVFVGDMVYATALSAKNKDAIARWHEKQRNNKYK